MNQNEIINRLKDIAGNIANVSRGFACDSLEELIKQLETEQPDGGTPQMSSSVPYLRLDNTGDVSTSNPKLHELYVHWAMHHLRVLDKAIKKLGRFSNSNVSNAQAALAFERRELITKNTAYRDAAAMLHAGDRPEPYDRNEGSAVQESEE